MIMTMDQDVLLMTPGPVELDSEILLAGARPLRHHRTTDFSPVYTDCVDRLKKIFNTKGELYLTLSSGTGVMETAIANMFNQGETVLTVETGSFGERFTQIAKAFKLNVIPLKYQWGHRAKVEDIRQMLKEPSPPAQANRSSSTATRSNTPRWWTPRKQCFSCLSRRSITCSAPPSVPTTSIRWCGMYNTENTASSTVANAIPLASDPSDHWATTPSPLPLRNVLVTGPALSA